VLKIQKEKKKKKKTQMKKKPVEKKKKKKKKKTFKNFSVKKKKKKSVFQMKKISEADPKLLSRENRLPSQKTDRTQNSHNCKKKKNEKLAL